MSLILEALRKSEAERQRGQAPGLFTQQAPPPARRGGAGPVRAARLAGALALATAVAGGLWWLATHTPAPPPTGVAPRVATDPATGSPRAEARPAAAAVPAANAPPPTPAPRPAATASASPGFPAVRSETADTLPGTAPAAGPEPATVRVGEAAAVAESAATDPASALPRLADLPAAERGALPPLRLSMHVFSADPAQRFVILDGRRLGEGGSPAPAVVVEAIERDGLVLRVQDRAYWLGR